MKTQTPLDPRNFFNEELIESNWNSHQHKPNHIEKECISCETITPHSKWINSNGSFAHYDCNYCYEDRNNL